jgi:hypothetical protein
MTCVEEPAGFSRQHFHFQHGHSPRLPPSSHASVYLSYKGACPVMSAKPYCVLRLFALCIISVFLLESYLIKKDVIAVVDLACKPTLDFS